jgi:hypothetical protein
MECSNEHISESMKRQVSETVDLQREKANGVGLFKYWEELNEDRVVELSSFSLRRRS